MMNYWRNKIKYPKIDVQKRVELQSRIENLSTKEKQQKKIINNLKKYVNTE